MDTLVFLLVILEVTVSIWYLYLGMFRSQILGTVQILYKVTLTESHPHQLWILQQLHRKTMVSKDRQGNWYSDKNSAIISSIIFSAERRRYCNSFCSGSPISNELLGTAYLSLMPSLHGGAEKVKANQLMSDFNMHTFNCLEAVSRCCNSTAKLPVAPYSVKLHWPKTNLLLN